MTMMSRPPARANLSAVGVPWWGWLLAGAAVAAGFAFAYRAAGAGMGPAQLRLDPSPLLEAGWLIQLHLGGALAAFAIGWTILLRPKGGGLHRTLGWSWVAAMAVTAVSSFAIRGDDGSMSWIHAISAWVVIAVPFALASIRMRHVRMHARFMTGVFVGGMLIAGLFTFLPGRLMWSLFFAA